MKGNIIIAVLNTRSKSTITTQTLSSATITQVGAITIQTFVGIIGIAIYNFHKTFINRVGTIELYDKNNKSG